MKGRRILATAAAVVVAAVAIALALARTGGAGGVKAQKGTPHAFVQSDGTLLGPYHSKDVVSAERTGAGIYVVSLKGAIGACSPVASLAGNGVGGSAGTSLSGTFDIGVETFDAAGSLQDRSFFLAVACDK